MEPCLFRHGKGLGERVGKAHRGDASMEPCLFRHGKRGRRGGRRHPLSASMEPCLFRHGKQTIRRRVSMTMPKLQWSHVFSDMVRGEMYVSKSCAATASMEPCLFRHGKRVVLSEGQQRLRASMEPCLFRHGKGGGTDDGVPEPLASMEPCLFRHGKRLRMWPLVCPGVRFNGAMSFQTW